MQIVSNTIEKANLLLQPPKCVFAKSKVQYLGHVVSREGISASPDKVKAVREYPTPKSVKDVRSFLGLASFYRRLIPKFCRFGKAPNGDYSEGDRIYLGGKAGNTFPGFERKAVLFGSLSIPSF